MSKQLTLGSIITDEEAKHLIEYVAKKRTASASTHNIIMGWIDKHKQVQKRLVDNGLIKAYAAYLIEYFLKL